MSVSDLRLAATVGLYLIAKRRREEAEERKQEWLDRSQDNLTRWGNSHERNVESIKKLLLNKEKLEGMLESARSTSRQECVTGWLAENQERIDSLEDRNAELLGKIRDLQSRLQDAGAQNVHVPLTTSLFATSISARILRPTPNRRIFDTSISLNKPPRSTGSSNKRGRR